MHIYYISLKPFFKTTLIQQPNDPIFLEALMGDTIGHGKHFLYYFFPTYTHLEYLPHIYPWGMIWDLGFFIQQSLHITRSFSNATIFKEPHHTQ